MADHPDAHEVISAYERFNQPVPNELRPPEIPPIYQPYWRAYCELITESDGSIPWSSIVLYAHVHGFEVQELVDIIRIADSAKKDNGRHSRTKDKS